jgi:peroxiredoxin
MTIQRVVVVVFIVCGWLTACDRERPAQAAPPPLPPAAAAKPAPAQPAPAAAAAKVAAPLAAAALGKPAPDFTLTDSDGKTHALSALRGKTVVLEWFNPDCPFVRFAHSQGPLKGMSARVARADRVWLSINSSAPDKQGHGVERNQRARREYAMTNPVLLDETGQVGKAYGAIKTPHLFVIDPSGVLVFRGGIDNAPMGEVDAARPRAEGSKEGGRVNYVEAALEDLQKQRPIGLADVPPYGCSIKYAS